VAILVPIIVAIIAFGRRLSQETLEILPSDDVIFYTDGSLCAGRVGAGVFLDTLDIMEILCTWPTCYGLHWEYFFRMINNFVHKFILDRTFVDFTVSLLILPFYIVDFNSKW
jgi:hypothetical protein